MPKSGPRGPRPSLFGWTPDPAVREALLDERVDAELKGTLAARLLSESPTAELAHVVLAGVVAVLVWPTAPRMIVGLWLAAVVAASLTRAVVRSRLAVSDVEPDDAIRRVRWTILASGLAWAIGAAALVPTLAFQDVTLIMVIFAGLVAGATATLVADRFSFNLFMTALLAPLAIGIVANGQSRSHVVAVALVILFGGAMLVVFRRSHRAFSTHMRTLKRLELTQDAVLRERRFLDALLASAPNAIVTLAGDGLVRGVNPAFERMFGYSADELVGQDLNELIVPSDGLPRAHEIDQTVGGGGTVIDEVERQHRDGRLLTVRLAAAPIRGVADDNWFVLYDDITAMVQAERRARSALEESREVAERAARAKSAFLANMSHEIRTPMNGVLGMTELLLDTDLSADQRRSAELIRSSAEALLTVINDILDFSKIEAGQIDLESIVFDLPGLVDSTVRLLAVKAFEQGIELAHDIHADVPEVVRGDPARLRQVLNNLIGNAVKFTHDGEVVVSVSRKAPQDGVNMVQFSVRDTGIGIPKVKLEVIFEEFSQADVSTTREYGGTGLGLAIVNRIVSLIGGEIAVESEEHKGSTFSFTAPLEEVFDQELASAVGAYASLHGARALVIDDNSTNRRIVREMLGLAGVAVDEAGDCQAGFTALTDAATSAKPFQLAIIDAYMPGEDGFALAARVRDAESLRETRLMMLTSGGQRGDGQRCRELGIRAYLPKPVSRFDLLEAAAAVLTGSGARDRSGMLVTRHSIEETRRRLRILLAEDNPLNQTVALTMLQKRGHKVDVVDNGRAAVDAVTHKRYDVVLMDVQMPELDGIAATEAIRDMDDHGALPIIAITAHALVDERERCMEAGMNGFVAKPFKPHELFAAVEGLDLDVALGSPPLQSEEADPVHLDEFRRTMREAGVEDAVDKMIEVFLQDAPQRMVALQAAIEAADSDATQKAAHAFKSAASTIRAAHLADLLKDVEAAARNEMPDEATGLLQRIRVEYELALEYLHREISESAGTTS